MKMENSFRFIVAAVFAFLMCGCAKTPARLSPSREPVFPIMSWELPPRTQNFSDPHHGLGSLAECGFTVAGFIYGDQLPACRSQHLQAILCPAKKNEWERMSDEQIDRAVHDLVGRTAGDPSIIGYFLTDEPGVRKFPALGKAVAAIHKYAPGKLAYINLFPDYATLGAPNLSQLGTESYHEYLERFVEQVKPQFISYDNYRVQFSEDLKNAAVAQSYFRNMIEVRSVALEHHLPFWVIVSSNEIRPFTPVPSPANLLMQAYTTLAAGGGGLTWFTYYAGGYRTAPIDKAGHRTLAWSYLKMVNDQVKTLGPILRTLHSTGVYYNQPPTSGLTALPGELIESISAATPIMLGEFCDDSGHRWAVLVNLSLRESAKVTIKWTAKIKGASLVSPVDASLDPLKDDTLWLTAGQGVLLKLEGQE